MTTILPRKCIGAVQPDGRVIGAVEVLTTIEMGGGTIYGFSLLAGLLTNGFSSFKIGSIDLSRVAESSIENFEFTIPNSGEFIAPIARSIFRKVKTLYYTILADRQGCMYALIDGKQHTRFMLTDYFLMPFVPSESKLYSNVRETRFSSSVKLHVIGIPGSKIRGAICYLEDFDA